MPVPFTETRADTDRPSHLAAGAPLSTAPAGRDWRARVVDWLYHWLGGPSSSASRTDRVAIPNPPRPGSDLPLRTPGRRVLLPLASRWGVPRAPGAAPRAHSLAEALQTVLLRDAQGNTPAGTLAGGPGDAVTSVMPGSAASWNVGGPLVAPLPSLAAGDLPSVAGDEASEDPLVTSSRDRVDASPMDLLVPLADPFRANARATAWRERAGRIATWALSDFGPEGAVAPLAGDALMREGDLATLARRTKWLGPVGVGVEPWMGGTDAESVKDHPAQPSEVGSETWPRAPRPAVLGKDRVADEAQRGVEGLSMLEERLDRLEQEGTLARVAPG